MLTMVLALLLALSMSSAYAEDLGIQVIGGPNAATQTQSLDDIQVGTTYTLDGFAKVTPVEYLVVDYFAQFNKDADYTNIPHGYGASHVYFESPIHTYDDYCKDASWQDSGMNAEFIWLKLDITNLQKEPISFMKNIEVKVTYDGEYEFAGWVRQINYDYNIICYRYGSTTKGGATIVIHASSYTTAYAPTLPAVKLSSWAIRVPLKISPTVSIPTGAARTAAIRNRMRSCSWAFLASKPKPMWAIPSARAHPPAAAMGNITTNGRFH